MCNVGSSSADAAIHLQGHGNGVTGSARTHTHTVLHQKGLSDAHVGRL